MNFNKEPIPQNINYHLFLIIYNVYFLKVETET